MVSVTVLLALVIALGPSLLQVPPRDVRELPSSGGDSNLSGTVFGQSAGPLANASVVLSSQKLNRTWRTVTNDAGQFAFQSLPEGLYALVVSHPQYLPAHYGQTFVGQEGRALQLGSGEFKRVDIVAVKGGAITGRVVDTQGNPAMDVLVQAYRAENVGGRQTFQAVPSRTYRSNDIGEYRISNLVPGEYYLGAQPILRDVSGAKYGAAPGVSVIWYPGTLRANEAQRVRVGVESEAKVFEFRLQPVLLTHVAGSLMLPAGVSPREVTVQLIPRSDESGPVKRLLGGVDGEGRFLIERVPPGQYDLIARAGGMRLDGRISSVAGALFYGYSPVEVADRPLEGISLGLMPAGAINGRIEADPPLHSPEGISVSAHYEDEAMGIGQSATVDRGQFRLPVGPGKVRLTVSGLPMGWVVERIQAGGKDLLRDGIDTKGGGAHGVVVTVSQAAQVSGGLEQGATDAVSDYTVVLMSADPKLRTPSSGGVVVSRADSRGRFLIGGLRAGSYVIAAVDYISRAQHFNHDTWRRIEAVAKSLELGRGQTVTASVPFVKLLK